MTVAGALRDVPLFSQLRDGDVARLSQAAQLRSFPRDSIIALQSDPGNALYVIVSGQVKLVLTAEDGREVILSTRSEGDFFGEMSLIDNQPLSATVIAMEDAQLLVLRREDFYRCLEDFPQVTFGLLRALCKRLRKADDKIGSLALLEVPGRVAHLLLELADESDGVHVTQQVTHHFIAQMIGSSRETVSRAMRDLTAQGLIEVSRKTLAIANRRKPPESSAPSGEELIEVTRRTITVRNRKGLEAAAGRP
ncbi:MAG: cyclic nucleotide-binding domain-containing protein [Gemmatimonadales bacterium]|nr:cyclic nucleotide-binding domain-containing protein [Gemmatimonadales bacterium]NIN12511.1 cyclic nucleotide-binding domain-containing protein [Gemmatimonadales bacterium]NIN50882.1 cyclic nucleotide-binding domain-containing protein [Gemmatimonadales bacterium]NIP08346.1 cyclic nucleotide-binding domain-containing protein [Gemmatimonadales bacterium]NIR03443.1 cyclic nucleotide-binding domain-containing protein [Gemmatimonadales bacterium]